MLHEFEAPVNTPPIQYWGSSMSDSSDDGASRKQAVLRMLLVKGLGLRSAHRLLGRYEKNPETVLQAGAPELEQVRIRSEVARNLRSAEAADRAEQQWVRATEGNTAIVDLSDSEYPPLLARIFDPPLVLYIRGRKWDPMLAQVAIVGTGQASVYGINAAERLAEDLADRGLAITSGLARGIDVAAYRRVLRAGTTCAVLGHGLDRVYPKENRKLAELVESNDAIISEFCFGTPPVPENFPARNRIISGMSLGTVVVEAAGRSDSLITARLALDFGQEVFAVSGSIASTGSFGPHALIRDGEARRRLAGCCRRVAAVDPSGASRSGRGSARPAGAGAWRCRTPRLASARTGPRGRDRYPARDPPARGVGSS